MKTSNQQSKLYFFFTQLLCIFTYILLVAILYSQDLATEHFWYGFPVLILFYMPLYYLMFWYPRNLKCIRRTFLIYNLAMLITTTGIFFGVYFGVFYKTMQYNVHKVSDCQVIGKQSNFLYGVDNYSILYVDFQKDGHNMLGYGCLSTNYNESAGTVYLAPHYTIKYGEFFQCINSKASASYQQKSNRLLQNGRMRLMASRRSRSRRSRSRTSSSSSSSSQSSYTYCYYTWSQVKLPDWMCQPFDIDHEELSKKQDCYVHYFKGNLDTDTAIKNSQERVQLIGATEFAMVTFTTLPVPLDQFMCLLIFVFCPFIMAFNLPFSFITNYLLDLIEKSIKKFNKFKQNGLLRQISKIKFNYSQKAENKKEIEFMKPSQKQNLEDFASPMISNHLTTNMNLQQQDGVIEPLGQNENLNLHLQIDKIRVGFNFNNKSYSSDDQSLPDTQLKKINTN